MKGFRNKECVKGLNPKKLNYLQNDFFSAGRSLILKRSINFLASTL